VTELTRDRAYHEAGHAVVGTIQPVGAVRRASIRKNKHSAGRVTCERPSATWWEAVRSGSPAEAQQAAAPVIRRAWAGIIAEANVSGKVNMAGSSTDFETINMLAYQVAWEGADTDLSAYTGRLRRETEAIIKEHWPAIQAVAAALMKRRSLLGDEIRELVKSSMSPTGPPPA
jgi:ATP-dependent Zn protease